MPCFDCSLLAFLAIIKADRPGGGIDKDTQLQLNQNAEQTYHSIRQSIVSAQHRLCAAVNSAPKYEKIVKGPYVMEFLQIQPDTHVYEGELEQAPIGIVLCADKGDSVVKYTLPEDNQQIFASKYFTYLPTEEELKQELRLDDFRKLDD